MSAVFYGDIACPFCFAENERLIRLGLEKKLPFRALCYLPELPSPWDPQDAQWQQLLDDGLERLREKAPDLHFVRPEAIPNSLRATRAIAEATMSDPEKAVALRTWLFRALWQEGRDVGLDEVVEDGLERVGLPTVLGKSRESRRTAKVWHVEWSNGGFDGRIPVLANAEGQRLLGLAEDDVIRQFVEDPTQGAHLPLVCKA